jgi:hypothetical protein
MSWITDVFTSSVGTVVEKAGEAIDRLVTSDAEKLQLKNELVKIELDAKTQADSIDLEYSKQVTIRHENDMKSDSWLSKNIRPLALIYILVMYSLLSISSGFEFEVTPAYVELLGNWGMLIMSFYFAGRTVEKIKSINN